jgi:hypothetical protein
MYVPVPVFNVFTLDSPQVNRVRVGVELCGKKSLKDRSDIHNSKLDPPGHHHSVLVLTEIENLSCLSMKVEQERSRSPCTTLAADMRRAGLCTCAA